MPYPSKARMLLEIFQSMWKNDIEYMYEMATSRGQMISKIQSYSSTLVEHLLKIRLLEGTHHNTAVNHWIHEVRTILHTIHTYKYDGKKRLHPHEYFTLLFDEYVGEEEEQELYAIVHNINFTYKTSATLSQRDIQDLHIFIRHLSQKLAERVFTYEDMTHLIESQWMKGRK